MFSCPQTTSDRPSTVSRLNSSASRYPQYRQSLSITAALPCQYIWIPSQYPAYQTDYGASRISLPFLKKGSNEINPQTKRAKPSFFVKQIRTVERINRSQFHRIIQQVMIVHKLDVKIADTTFWKGYCVMVFVTSFYLDGRTFLLTHRKRQDLL